MSKSPQNSISFHFLFLVFRSDCVYVIGVTIFVKCKGYLTPSNGKSPRDKALRGPRPFAEKETKEENVSNW